MKRAAAWMMALVMAVTLLPQSSLQALAEEPVIVEGNVSGTEQTGAVEMGDTVVFPGKETDEVFAEEVLTEEYAAVEEDMAAGEDAVSEEGVSSGEDEAAIEEVAAEDEVTETDETATDEMAATDETVTDEVAAEDEVTETDETVTDEVTTEETVIAGDGIWIEDITVLNADAEITVEQKVEQIAAECIASGAGTEYAKAMWLHDWLIYHANYDYTFTEYGPEGVLLKGTGVCQSYTTAYSLLLNKVGIENMVLTSPEMNHAWNIVKINGSWTHIDCTWDDPNEGGYENHQYFGLGDVDMKLDHTWSYSAYPECFPIVKGDAVAILPEPYPLNAPVQGINFTFIDKNGSTITRNDITEGNVLLIHGRPVCSNTMGFVKELSMVKETVDANKLNVFVVFENKEQVDQYADSIPFTCVYAADFGYEMYDFLKRIGITGSYMYPLVVLQDLNGYAYYHSTGYVSEPLRVLATAVQDINHVAVTVHGTAPTCTAGGWTEGCYCSICGTVLKQQEYLPPEGHKWGAWITVAEATVQKAQVQNRTCSVCGAVEEREYGEKLQNTDLPGNGADKPTGIQIDSKKITLSVGDSVKLKPVITPAASAKKVSYKTSNKKIATVTSKGKVTAKKPGKATITIKSGKQSVKVVITVKKAAAVKIKNVPAAKKLARGKTYTFKPKVTPAGGKNKITYKTSNKKVVTIDSKGKAKAKKPGTATISVKAGKATVKCKITVK